MSSNIKTQRICQYCGKEFIAKTTVTKYCSHACNSRAYKANVKNLKIQLSNTETQQIKVKPIEELNAKPFLSISESCQLLGVSRRTIYRMIERKNLTVVKIGSRSIIKRSDIDRIFI